MNQRLVCGYHGIAAFRQESDIFTKHQYQSAFPEKNARNAAPHLEFIK